MAANEKSIYYLIGIFSPIFMPFILHQSFKNFKQIKIKCSKYLLGYIRGYIGGVIRGYIRSYIRGCGCGHAATIPQSKLLEILFAATGPQSKNFEIDTPYFLALLWSVDLIFILFKNHFSY